MTFWKIIHFLAFSFRPPAGEPTWTGQERALETKPNYVAFVLVPVFFLLGLLGVVICHVLKRKGYRCTTEPQDEEEMKCQELDKDAELGEGGRTRDCFMRRLAEHSYVIEL